jgi:kynurenine formamidase
VKALEPGYPITIDDLEAALKHTGLTLRSGDAVLIRTGRAPRPPDRRAGLHVSTVKWLRDRDVALVGSDDSIDAWPSEVEGIRSPIHVLLLVAMGTPILDHLDLNALMEAAAQRRRWEFVLTVAPLPVIGATGSLVNPIAFF